MKPAIKFNPKLLWDYSLTEQDLEREDVLIFYISRVLNNGTLVDVQGIPLDLIEKYFDRLFSPRRIRVFWERYLGKEPSIGTPVRYQRTG